MRPILLAGLLFCSNIFALAQTHQTHQTHQTSQASQTSQILQTPPPPRNLLHRFSRADILQSLAAPGDWHPFPQTPQAWKSKLPDSTISALIKKGGIASEKDFRPLPATIWLEFIRTGNRVNFEAQSFAKRNQLLDLVLAESVEGKGRFTDQILNGVWSICEETFWGLPAHVAMQRAGKGLPDAADPVVDLFAAETASVLAWTDYFAGAALRTISPLVHERIRYEINRRIFQPILTAKYEYMGYGDYHAKVNNWAPWIMSNYITASLLLETDTSKRADAIMLALKYLDQYLNGLGDDGAGDEGPLYWFAAGGTAFDALNLLFDASAGKISVFQEPFIRKMGTYVYKTHIAGRYFLNIADAIPEIDADGVMLYRYGKATGDKQMMGFGSWATRHIGTKDVNKDRFFKSRIIYNLAAAAECEKYPDQLPDPQPVWFPDIQLMTAQTSNGLYIASHGGNNGESHNHNDVGDFLLYSDGEPIIIDAGAGTYTARTFSPDRYKLWSNTSSYHNLPTLNDQQQRDGLTFRATDVSWQNSANAVRLSMDIARAYDSSAGIHSWKRDVAVDQRADNIQISDQYVFTGINNRIVQSFMTICGTDIQTPGRLVFITAAGKKVYLDYDGAKYRATKEQVPLNQPEDEKIKLSWHLRPVWRILLTRTDAPKTGRSVYRIHK